MLLRYFGMQLGEPFDVRLVENRFMPGNLRPHVPAPIERVFGDDGFRNAPGIVAIVAIAIVEQTANRRMWIHFSVDAPRVGIQKKLLWMEAMTFSRRPSSVCAKPITL